MARIALRFARTTLTVALLLLSGACERAWDFPNRSELRSDVEHLLAQQGIVEPTIVSCHMLSTTRTGICNLILGEDDVSQLVTGLDLTRFDPADGDHVDLVSAASSASGECLDLTMPTTDQTIWIGFRRSSQLRLENGSSFEYVILVYWPAEALVCLRLGYSYG